MKKKLLAFSSFCLLFAGQVQADQMRVLETNEAALAIRFNLIKTAKSEILAEYFEVTKDDTSMQGLALLQEAARRGVTVKLLVDNMYNKLDRQDMAVVTNVLKKMEDTKNFEIKVFNPLSSPNVLKLTYRNHDKLMVVDGDTMVVGGRNVGDGYFGLSKEVNFRDLDVMIKGDSASRARKYFYDLWATNPMVKNPRFYEHTEDGVDKTKCIYMEGGGYDCEQRADRALKQMAASQNEMKRLLTQIETRGLKLKNAEQFLDGAYDVDVQFVYNDPTQLMANVQDKLANQLYRIIGQNIKKSITIVTPYLFPTQEAMNLLAGLTARGIQVRIITNSLASTDTPLVHAAYLTIKDDLARMGAEVYEYAGKEVLHAKVAIIDAETENVMSLIGSFNFDRRSALINREVAVVITGKDRAKVGMQLGASIRRIVKDSVLSVQGGHFVNSDKLEQMVDGLGEEEAAKKREELEKNKGLVLLIPNHI